MATAYTRGNYKTKHREKILKEIQRHYPEANTIKDFLVFAQDHFKMGVKRLSKQIEQDTGIYLSPSFIYRTLKKLDKDI